MGKVKVLWLLIWAMVAVCFVPQVLSAQTVKDVLTAELFNANGYDTYSGIRDVSNAVYSGNMKKSDKGAIQLRQQSSSGIVSTVSGGLVKSVTVTWHNTDSNKGRILNVYGKSTAYASTQDLYSDAVKTQGTKLGTIVCGNSFGTSTLIIDGDYEYIGMCSDGGTIYLDNISIVWQSDEYIVADIPVFTPAAGKYADTQYVTISTESGNAIYYTMSGENPTVENGVRYDGTPICVEESATIKAVTVDESSGEMSDVVTAEYLIERVFAFDASAAVVTLGRTFTAPVLTNTYHGGNVTWTTSDDNVAMVDNDGNVTAVSAGTATVAAALVLPDAEPLVASYVLTVKDAPVVPVGGAYYKRVTSNDDIVDGGVYIIVNESAGMAMGAIENYGIGGAVDIDDEICIASSALDIVLEMQSNGIYALKSSGGYIGYNKSGTEFAGLSKSVSSNYYKWTIDVVRPDSVVIRTFYNVNFIGYRQTSKDFRVYTSINSNSKITLYRKMGALKITAGGQDADGRYYATYFTDMPFVAPADVRCATVGVSDGRLVVDEYLSGSVVPACVGLLVSASDAGVYEYAVTSKKGVAHAGNMLKGDVHDMTTEGDNCMFFRLAKPAGESLGFWWGAPDGAAFALGAYKAYLAVPNGVSMAKGFSFGASVTGISPATRFPAADDSCYGVPVLFDAGGRRVGASPRPGLYIVKGKKILLK